VSGFGQVFSSSARCCAVSGPPLSCSKRRDLIVDGVEAEVVCREAGLIASRFGGSSIEALAACSSSRRAEARNRLCAVDGELAGGLVRLAIGGAPRNRAFAVGESFHFSPADIHRVRHAGSDPAVTLHVYSPPLQRMGAYVVASDGVLARHSVSSAVELRPLHTAGQLVR
jgi:hypothetical protein